MTSEKAGNTRNKYLHLDLCLRGRGRRPVLSPAAIINAALRQNYVAMH
jgi:hypothetical protein